ncbi:MAG: hypothetical protein KDA89_18615 [Planctomycetaceae bacterium]|nr:hypothetical protein [Planctomycetaceae bacterium]
MSEFQYVVFQAVDRPLNDRELAFAERQSSRADVSRWSLSCEYHYSSFRGDVDGLLRRGYDVFLRYTNYGDREIKMRLPQGLPFAKSVWSKYIDGARLEWKKDSKGSGGILSLHPYHEPGDLEEVWEFKKHLDAAIQVRQQLIAGDLRSLYLLWLCAVDAHDEDEYGDAVGQIEPPVPHGLADMSDGSLDLLLFYGLDPLLLDAAGQDVAAAPADEPQGQPTRLWAESLTSDRARDLLCQLLSGDTAAVKAGLLAEVRDAQPPMIWPTTDRQLPYSELAKRADALRSKANAEEARKAQAKVKRDAAKAERERQARMKKMVEDPRKWLRQAEDLADARGTHNYQEAAEILFDLREAIGGPEGDEIVRGHAAHLAKKHPTLNHLKSSLRKRGLLE